MRAAIGVGSALAIASAVAGCADPRASLPTVSYEGAALSRSPSQQTMAAYYCPRVVPDPLGLTPQACEIAFGAAPAPQEMTVAFDLQFKLHNPNGFPIPVAEMLTAVTLFPGDGSQALGASCVVFCSADDPSCTGQPGPGACSARSGDLRSIDDFGAATANLLLASGVAVAQGETPSFEVPRVVQDGDATIQARFAFGVDPLLAALQRLAEQSVQELAAFQSPTFTIPYRIEGTVWLDVGSLGRVAVGLGPAEGTWTIPASALTPGS